MLVEYRILMSPLQLEEQDLVIDYSLMKKKICSIVLHLLILIQDQTAYHQESHT